MVQDEHGRVLDRLISQTDPRRPSALKIKSRQSGCGGIVRQALSGLQSHFILPVVHAQLCEVIPCADHYMEIDIFDCPPACLGEYFEAYGGSDNYSGGWLQNGSVDCPLGRSTVFPLAPESLGWPLARQAAFISAYFADCSREGRLAPRPSHRSTSAGENGNHLIGGRKQCVPHARINPCSRQ